MMESPNGQISHPTDPDNPVLKAWGQGLMVGPLIIMAAVILANMKGHILLHKLILVEVVPFSISAVALNISWSQHNVISWLKSRPLFSRKVSIAYITTVLLVQPYWVLEIYANFTYFNINRIFEVTRPLEPLFRDPWWICTACSLFSAIKCSYNFGVVELVTFSPRLGIMLASMCLSIVFIIVDTCSVLGVFNSASLSIGVQPFWKLSLIFKCLCVTIILDDFKAALDSIRSYRQQNQARTHPSNSDIYQTNRRPQRSVSACQLTLEEVEEGLFGIEALRATRHTA
ncbi:uncharacterized protein BDW70DRAFT_152353 [Aspergillus foveolatus]|uniref:uncharacterized protein n=1 Tax=Aspergillus foveolatus TaxID=210207 RepID=UPI003CCE2FDD